MRRENRNSVILAGLTVALACTAARAGDLDEFRVKREAVYTFAAKPTAEGTGDRVTIRFTTKGYCDVTVAIEDAKGRIIRHLASGVLGPTAPVPFRKGTKEQAVVWDGKDDQGCYVDDRAALSVRISLGLKPRFERTLLWSPHKQRAALPVPVAAPEGVYVYGGSGVDHVRLFDHDGNYVRTVYPFPADKLKDVAGLRWHAFPQGYRRPLKEGLYQNTLLTSGDNDSNMDKNGMTGFAAMGMAVGGKRIALAFEHLNRLATDGTSGGLPLRGPATGFVIHKRGYGGYGTGKQVIGPTSLAFSPDGKTVYMTGFLWRQRQGHSGCFHVVLAADFEKDDTPSVFAGSRDYRKFGRGNDQLAVPTSVACDPAGNVYVSDFLNDRIQIFTPGGKHLASIKVDRPVKVMVHQKTGEIFVCSWAPIGVPGDAWRAYKYDPKKIKSTLTRFSAYPKCRRLSSEAFPLGPAGSSHVFQMGQLHQVELDSWFPGAAPVFWVTSRKFVATRADHRILYIDHSKVMDHRKWARGIRVIRKQDGKWVTLASFGDRALKKVQRVRRVNHNIQHLYVNPKTGKLYVGEADSGPTIKAFKRLVEIDPATGRIRFVELPFNAMDVAFDLNGLIYLRTTDVVVRYDPRSWREIPWDYGEELPSVTCGISGRSAPATGGLVMPTVSPVCFHQGGMSVSPMGHLAVACSNRPKGRKDHHDFTIFGKESRYGKPYRPQMYPGREESSTSCSVHVWDRHGKLIHGDAIMGLTQIDGVHVDRRGDLYVMATPTRIHDGKRYFNDLSSTVIKFRPGRGRFINPGKTCPVPLPESSRPERRADLYRNAGDIWVEGAEWFYGGVGFAGFNSTRAGGGCACWFARFTLDYFARSFAPEPYQYSVAVLDSGGNLITRIGKYGNVDDGAPTDPKGGPPRPRSIGGDEVGLFHADFVGVHTDHRLFIADLGNARILSVKLGYHASEKIALKHVRGAARGGP